LLVPSRTTCGASGDFYNCYLFLCAFGSCILQSGVNWRLLIPLLSPDQNPLLIDRFKPTQFSPLGRGVPGIYVMYEMDFPLLACLGLALLS